MTIVRDSIAVGDSAQSEGKPLRKYGALRTILRAGVVRERRHRQHSRRIRWAKDEAAKPLVVRARAMTAQLAEVLLQLAGRSPGVGFEAAELYSACCRFHCFIGLAKRAKAADDRSQAGDNQAGGNQPSERATRSATPPATFASALR